MKIKLNRYMNIVNPNFMIRLGIFAAILLVFALTSRQWLASGVCFVIVMIFMPWDYPLTIEVANGQISYRQRVRVPLKHGRGWKTTKVRFVVTNIESIEFRQTPIERLFRVGHIYFSGKTDIETNKYAGEIPQRSVHRVYGIRKFDQFRAACDEFIKNECLAL